jgi:hypothetical protein
MSDGVTVDVSGLAPLEAGLKRAEKGLDAETGTRLQTARRSAGSELQAELKRSAAGSPTPQARIVAESITVSPDGSLAIGGGQSVGSRGTPAGVLVYGSERGGVNFSAPRGGSYWIAPAVDRYSAGGAERVYTDAVNGILHDAGLL